MPQSVSASQDLAAAYRALVTIVPAEHLHLVANFLLACQHSTLKQLNAVVGETAHDVRATKEDA